MGARDTRLTGPLGYLQTPPEASGLREAITAMPPTPLVVVLVVSDLEFGGAQRQVVELANHTLC